MKSRLNEEDLNGYVEIKILSQIKHENIIQCFDYFYFNQTINIITEYCEVNIVT
jgi:hypothetical protein